MTRAAVTVCSFSLPLSVAALLVPLLALAPGAAQAQETGKGKGDAKKGGDPKTPAGETGAAKKEDAAKEGAKTEVLSVDEQYVRENIERFLHPSEIKFLPDGRAQLKFDFRKKNDDHTAIFSPPVGSNIKDRFRWSLPDEENWSTADGNDIGLRVSNQGMTLLNCWFTDDLEAEMCFVQKVSFNDRMYAALIFANDKQAAIGSNFGTQCALFRSGTYSGGKGATEPVVNDASNVFGLAVKDGVFRASRKGRPKAEMKYPEKSFESGRLGIAWGGNVMAFVAEISVTGKLDYPKMAKFFQKARR
jgi:hypothetical protein